MQRLLYQPATSIQLYTDNVMCMCVQNESTGIMIMHFVVVIHNQMFV